MRSTPKPPSVSQPPPLPPPVPKHPEQSGSNSAKDTDDRIKWILAAAITAGILTAVFLIPLMLLRSNGGGSADGKDDRARVKGAVAMSIDNGISKAMAAPESLPAQPSPVTTTRLWNPPT